MAFRRRRSFLSAVNIRGRAAQVLIRMVLDTLVEYENPHRLILHSLEPQTRPSVEIRSASVCALVNRGLVFPESFDFQQGKRSYELTDEGKEVARMLCIQAKNRDSMSSIETTMNVVVYGI
jgi:hypothetical protein